MNRIETDYVVIGSGPGGQSAAIQLAKKGKKVTIVDKRDATLGGVSLHSGTIPSKTLREAVIYLRGLKRQKVYGASNRFKEKIRLKDLLERVDIILTRELEVLKCQLNRNGVVVVYGEATFLNSDLIEISKPIRGSKLQIQAKKFIIASGTVPRRPTDIPFDHNKIFDSDFIFSSKSQITELPQSLIIYGSGVIGSEYALMFGALGIKVWLVDSHEKMMPFIDTTVVNLFY